VFIRQVTIEFSMSWLLAVSIFGLVYPYVLYPLLLTLVGRVALRRAAPASELPRVAVLVSAFNEESRILEKIRNFDSLDYPPELMEIWIGTDGSIDRTAETIRMVNHPRVRLLERKERGGKTTVLNDLATRARADIFVFTDVNAHFRPDAVRRLTAPFSSLAVGLVSGRTLIRGGDGNVEVEGAYYRFESLLKKNEGARGWLAGADGAIYALRARLYHQLPREMINDLAHPCQAVVEGYEACFEPLAVSEEDAGDNTGREFDRQTRIAAQASYLLARQLWALIATGRWGMLWVLLSHKWLRWIAGIWIPLGLLALAGVAPVPAVIALCLLMLLGIGWRYGAPWSKLPVFFLVVHLAYLRGLWHAITGERYVVWTPRAG
jgi:cellulose synthase/poly-beta-1,6-N-acetylglucosamine synthase-like glycosyltransferase